MVRLYLRFSEDIHEDIERGHSFYFRTKKKMDGLCAWTAPFDIINGTLRGCNGEEVSEVEVINYAKTILKNTYGSYSDNSTVHLITGDYVGSGNDGVLLNNVELIKSIELSD